MEINGLEPVGGITGNPVTDGEITEETFLKLLSVQLQHQDPLEPASDVEFIQQMATFASLEQQRITNQNLSIMQLYESSINNSNALAIVGKEVKIADNAINHTAEGQSHTVFYDSDSGAARVQITVRDEDGREVFTSTQVGAEDGEQPFTWYGVDENGDPVEPGKYTIDITLQDENGTDFPTNVYQMERVDGISYENGSIMVLIGDRKLPIENVVEVYEPTEEGGGGFKTATKGNATEGVRAAMQALYGPLPGFEAAKQSSTRAFVPSFRVIPGGR